MIFYDWPQKLHAKEYLVFSENIAKRLSIDETCLANGELYTIITNKGKKGKKGCIVAIVAGTKAETVIKALENIPQSKRDTVEEITLDMANSMKLIVKKSFKNAKQVTDRFHVQKLASDALQDIRVKYRWEAIDKENQEIQTCKTNNTKHKLTLFENGDSAKQLLARSRYTLYKSQDKWTTRQKERAEILFREYPIIKLAYQLTQKLKNIYNQDYHKNVARTKLALWYHEIEKSGLKNFNIVSNTIQNNYDSILNYFNNRSTNASAESFNAKIKAFRAKFRGVKNIEFFLYRLTKIYA